MSKTLVTSITLVTCAQAKEDRPSRCKRVGKRLCKDIARLKAETARKPSSNLDNCRVVPAFFAVIKLEAETDRCRTVVEEVHRATRSKGPIRSSCPTEVALEC